MWYGRDGGGSVDIEGNFWFGGTRHATSLNSLLVYLLGRGKWLWYVWSVWGCRLG